MSFWNPRTWNSFGLFGSSGDVPENAANPSPPSEGESTLWQNGAFIGFGDVPGFREPPFGGYCLYRRMLSHPTIALARAMIAGPILSGSWSYEADEGVSDAWVELIQSIMDPIRPTLLEDAIRFIDYGWQPFEKVWIVRDGQLVIDRIKPLLPDMTEIRVTPHGRFAGVRNTGKDLPVEKSFIAVNDMEAGNYYGRSRLENVRDIWWKWLELDNKSEKLATKAAAIIPMIHYPAGVTKNSNGDTVQNSQQAQSILSGLMNAKGIVVPNQYSNPGILENKVDLTKLKDGAKLTSWTIEFLEAAGAVSSMDGMTNKQKYYDSLMVRGMLRPERMMLEGQFGTKAESQVQGDLGVLESEQLDKMLARQINQSIVNDLLTFNFGEEARNKVRIVPSPLVDEKRALFVRLFEAVLTSGQTLHELLEQIDFDAVADVLEIPKGEAVIEFKPPKPVETQNNPQLSDKPKQEPA
jgi:hypothetical protein